MCMEMHVKYYRYFEYRHIINRCCERSIFWSRISIVLKCLTISIAPVVVHYCTTPQQTLLVLYLPGIDSTKYPGYEITTVFHLLYVFLSGIILSFYELQILPISINVTCMGEILMLKMRRADCESKEILRNELKEIIKLYMDYVNLIRAFSQSYSTLITIKFLTVVMNISFALFVVQLVSSFINSFVSSNL